MLSFTEFANSRIIDSVKAINSEIKSVHQLYLKSIQSNVEDIIVVIFKVVLIFL